MIQWKAELETGIPSADYEHRKLVELVNELHEKALAAGSADEAAQSLGRLITHFTAHFAHEEEAMRDLDYAEFAGHKTDHDRIISHIDKALAELAKGVSLPSDLPDRIELWFFEHFRTWDTPLHKFLDRVE